MLSIHRYIDKEKAVFTHKWVLSNYKEDTYMICRKMGGSESVSERYISPFLTNVDSRIMYKYTHIWGIKLKCKYESEGKCPSGRKGEKNTMSTEKDKIFSLFGRI